MGITIWDPPQVVIDKYLAAIKSASNRHEFELDYDNPPPRPHTMGPREVIKEMAIGLVYMATPRRLNNETGLKAEVQLAAELAKDVTQAHAAYIFYCKKILDSFCEKFITNIDIAFNIDDRIRPAVANIRDAILINKNAYARCSTIWRINELAESLLNQAALLVWRLPRLKKRLLAILQEKLLIATKAQDKQAYEEKIIIIKKRFPDCVEHKTDLWKTLWESNYNPTLKALFDRICETQKLFLSQAQKELNDIQELQSWVIPAISEFHLVSF